MRHIESHIQRNCKKWFDLQYTEYYGLLFAIPNGVRTSATQGRVLKAEGMIAGVSDMILLIPRHGFGALCLEFKTAKGRQSDSQKQWQARAEKYGNKYVIIRSFEDFKKEVTSYLL